MDSKRCYRVVREKLPYIEDKITTLGETDIAATVSEKLPYTITGILTTE